MENITITFLGTGNAVPTRQRNHSAILFNYKNENILLDCGEGTQRQFRYAGISPCKLTRLLITHWHGDHILGIPGLLQTLAMTDYSKILEVHGPKGTKKNMQEIMKLVKENSAQLKVYENSSKVFENKELLISSAQMRHGAPANAYSIELKSKRRIDSEKLKKLKIPNHPDLKKLQEGKDIVINKIKLKAKDLTYIEKGKKITVVLDTAFNQEAIKLAKNSDILICEASFASEESAKAKESKHLTAKEAATIAKRAKVKELILTHLSQRYEHAPEIIEEEAKKVFKNTKLAKDLQSIII